MTARDTYGATGQPSSGHDPGRAEPTPRGGEEGHRLANALGWFSIGLGIAQLAAPGRMARLIGVTDDTANTATMRAIGAREIAAGVGLLMQPRPAEWAWGRVAGDAMDLALLGNALTSRENDRGRTAAAAMAVLGITALDVICAQRLTNTRTGQMETAEEKKRGIHVRKSITVDRPIGEVYRFWRDFENMPQFMQHVEAVQVEGDRRSRWRARLQPDTSIEWDAETTEDRENELIAWRSVEGSDVTNVGVVWFSPAPGRRGTEVHVDLRYSAPPGGKLVAGIAKLFGEDPAEQVARDLRRFKQVLETGEVVHSDASIHRGPHPAQPSEEATSLLADREQPLVVERSADAAATASSNLDRSRTTARGQTQGTRAEVRP